jgi:hypothetical protein
MDSSTANIVWVVGFPFFVGGLCASLGLLLTCGCAPSDFLGGPLGGRWMRLVGTRSVLKGRMVCFTLAIIVAALLGLGSYQMSAAALKCNGW